MNRTMLAAMAMAVATSSNVAEAKIEVGFGYDQGLGVMLQLNDQINGFVGNDGMTVDYLFARGNATQVENMPLNWYVGGGAFVGWDDGYGVRVPFGLELHMTQRWNAYVQVAPELDFDGKDKFGVDGAIGIRYTF
ncbi:hypothetical protein [Ferrimonas balearica]|uniref:hypothetical protein n=1 Tax=Ferrimonas balearica TaxID=44012 RepID=UPI001C57C544|nr:hypothetical protein [Ferrimonas balearica]MBW3164720.1 hypothetical protein [Ferrimonas balearica]